jgi:hypothetical protein
MLIGLAIGLQSLLEIRIGILFQFLPQVFLDALLLERISIPV